MTDFNCYLYEYRFRGRTYGFDIPATDATEAAQRLNAMQYATYQGEHVATIPVGPAGGMTGRDEVFFFFGLLVGAIGFVLLDRVLG